MILNAKEFPLRAIGEHVWPDLDQREITPYDFKTNLITGLIKAEDYS